MPLSLITRILDFFGQEVAPAEPPDEPAAAPRRAAKSAVMARQYAPILDAVAARLEHLARHEIPGHREIARHDLLELHYVEIAAADENGQALLDLFCAEFTPAARQEWVRDHIGGNPAVTLDALAGVYRSAELPSTDGLDRHLQILNQGAPAAYEVRLWKKWVPAPPAAKASAAAPARGPALVLQMRDGQGQHDDIHRETYPIKIGRRGDVRAEGTFVSSEHCALHWRDGQVLLEDHSRNGTWLDGARLHYGSKPLGVGSHRLKLGQAQGDAQDCPEIQLHILADSATPVAGATPLDAGLATPIAGDAPGGLLAVLACRDDTGEPHIDLLRLPFSLGRGAACDYVAPPGHAGVSSRHLVIEAVDGEGAQVFNAARAKNGTALDGALQGERFLWPYGGEVTLAPKWKSAPPVRILLKRPL